MEIRDNFKKGSMEMILLTLLREQDMYGYQLSQLIAERSDSIITIPEGSMYPTLYRLVENGYISSRRELVGRRLSRIYYHLETGGIDRLKLLWQEYSTFSQALDSIHQQSDEVVLG